MVASKCKKQHRKCNDVRKRDKKQHSKWSGKTTKRVIKRSIYPGKIGTALFERKRRNKRVN